jgi:hypothetical protein
MAVGLTNEMSGGLTDRAVVYTNIEESESKAFTTVYRTELGNLGYMVVMGDNADIGLEPKTPLTAARPTETAADLGPSYRGTYDGAAGTYDCTTGTGCTFTRTEQDDGSFTAVLTAGNTWNFTPDDGVQATVEDTDYLVFGAWLTEAVDTSTSRNVVAFANGADAFTTVESAPVGKATYSGPATGYYAKRNRNSAATAAGRFTAAATLNADFDTASDDGTISGEVTDFVILNPVDGIVGSNPDWSVALQGGNDDNTVDIAVNTTGTTGGAADGIAWDGAWGANFYGDATAGGDPLPTGIAGVFHAQSDGSTEPMYEDETDNILRADRGFVGVVGAFGAELDE